MDIREHIDRPVKSGTFDIATTCGARGKVQPHTGNSRWHAAIQTTEFYGDAQLLIQGFGNTHADAIRDAIKDGKKELELKRLSLLAFEVEFNASELSTHECTTESSAPR